MSDLEQNDTTNESPRISQNMAKEIKMVRVADLVPYEKNARTHSPEQVDKICKSIDEYGFTNPILVDGNKGIVAGHGRLMAAKKLGLKEVPTIDLSWMTETQKRAYIIADNRLAEDAGWDFPLLKAELSELKIDFDLSLTGFENVELENLLAEPKDILADVKQQENDYKENAPSYENEDKTGFGQVIVHFKTKEDKEDFFKRIGQTYTEKTKSIWYPYVEIEKYMDKEYV